LRVDEGHPSVELRITEQRGDERQHTFATDAQIELSQMLERLQQQTANREQYDGERRLEHDERMLEPMAACP